MRAWFLSVKTMGFILQVARATCFTITVHLIKKDFLREKKTKRERKRKEKKGKETERNVHEQYKHLVVGTFVEREKRLFALGKALFVYLNNKKTRLISLQNM